MSGAELEPDRTKSSFGRTKSDFYQFDAKNEPAGFQPDRTGQILNPAGPYRMEKTRPVQTLVRGCIGRLSSVVLKEY
jgi:hypothetical protein